MADVVPLLLVVGAGIGAAIVVRAVAVARPKALHRPHHVLTWAMVAGAAAGAAFADVSPTGLGGVDLSYRMAFAVVVTLAAGRAKRHARLVAGACAAIGSVGAFAWNLVAFVALGLATGSSASVRRPARPLGTAIGAMQSQVLLRLAWPDASYATALLATVASVVLVVSGVRHARTRERRPAQLVLGGLVVGGLASLVLLGVGLAGIESDLRSGAQAADRGLGSARAGETTEAVIQLERAQEHLAATDGLDRPWMRPARLLPVVGRYLDVGTDLTSAARAVVAPALESARLAAGDALQIRNGHVDLAAVAELRPPLERTLAAVPAARRAVQRLEREELPGVIASRVRDLDRSLGEAVEDGDFVLGALDLVPQLLGADSPRRWFILMQTPSEQRASGGIAGGFGELVVDAGQLELVRSGEGGELNPTGPWDLGPLAAEYDRFPGTGPERYFSNVTNTPHFPTVGRTIARVYPQAGGAPVDGVISVDPQVLGALLSLTGPISVPGWEETITADNAERTLLYEQYLRIDGGVEGRQFISDVIEATFDRLQSTTLPAPAQVLQTLSPMVQGQRLKLWSPRPEEQALFEEMGATGAMPEVEGDFFQLVTQNVGQSKIDWFQERTVSYDVEHDPVTGRVTAVATVTITNEAPSEDLPELLIGGQNFPEPGPPGRSRLFVDFYSPLDLDAVTLDGQRLDVVADEAFGRNLYWTVQTLDAGQSRTFRLHLSGYLRPGEPYVLDLGYQPIVRPDRVTVTVTGRDGSDLVDLRGLQEESGAATARFEQRRPLRFVAGSRT